MGKTRRDTSCAKMVSHISVTQTDCSGFAESLQHSGGREAVEFRRQQSLSRHFLCSLIVKVSSYIAIFERRFDVSPYHLRKDASNN